MSKYYAAKGEENSIFRSWEDCKAFLEGKKGYKYKSFSTEEEARAFLKGEDYYNASIENDLKSGYAVCYTDGSFEDGVNGYSYGVVAFSPDGGKEEFCGKGEEEGFLPSRNVAGEVLGALAAAKWAVVNGFYNLKIYHDYEGLSKWAKGEWAAKSPVAAYYVSEFSKYSGALTVEFVKVKGHSNNLYNEEVDSLAKAALFEGREMPVSGRFLKVSGEDAYKEICEYVHAQAPKAEWKDYPDGTVFSLGGEKLAVKVRRGATLVAGGGEKLYAVAVAAAISRDKGLIGRLIERAYGFAPLKDITDGYTASAELIRSFGGEECGKFLFFALSELSAAVKGELEEKGVKYDRILSLFDREKDGFRFKKRTYGFDLATEEAFNAFYRYRTEYFTKDYGRGEAEKALDDIARFCGVKDGKKKR